MILFVSDEFSLIFAVSLQRPSINYKYEYSRFVRASCTYLGLHMAVPEVDIKLFSELEAMGFPVPRATRALHFSANSSLEDAVDWIIDHENDPDIDEMPLVPVEINLDASASFPITEELRIRAEELRTGICKSRHEEEKEKDLERERVKAVRKSKLSASPGDPAYVNSTSSLSEVPIKLLQTSVSSISTKREELLRNCLRSIRHKYMEDDITGKKVFQTLQIYIGNVMNDPDEEKFRKIRFSNPIFQERVGNVEGGIKFLELCGFERANGGQFIYLPPDKINMVILTSAMSALYSAMTNPFFGLLSIELD